MSSNQAYTEAMDFYAGEIAKKRGYAQKVSPLSAWAAILLTIALSTTVLYAAGRIFFWDKFNTDPFYEQQFDLLEQRVSADPNNVESLVALGWAYFQRGDYNQALINFDKAASIDEKYFPALFNMGLTYLQTEKYGLAVNTFRSAVQLAPRDHVSHLNLGLAYTRNHEYDKAIDSLNTAYVLRPGAVEVLLALGEAYELAGMPDLAKEAYLETLRYDPNNKAARAALDRGSK